MTEIAALECAIGAVGARVGPITALLNNAANDTRHTIAETTHERWDAGAAVHRKHPFFAARSVAEDMKRAGGSSIVHGNWSGVTFLVKGNAGGPAMTLYVTFARVTVRLLSVHTALPIGL